jgi:hypothetical protein
MTEKIDNKKLIKLKERVYDLLEKNRCNDDNKDLCIEHNVEGYPTVIIKANGTSIDYEGPRTVDGLMDAIKKIGGM